MKIKKHKQSQKKWTLAALIGGFIVLIFLLMNYLSSQLPKTPYVLPKYEGILWQKEKPSSVYALLSPNTAAEEIMYTEGIEMTGEDIDMHPNDIYLFYDQALTRDGFEKINVVGDPEVSTYWVSSYKKNYYYVEVQYYVTPDNKDTRTSMLFSGILPK
jgi:hypothetical protein